jgi:DNA-binding HxlR family transcriptional regulator
VPKRYRQRCPVARSLEFLGERWTLLIVRDLANHGPLKFQDLTASLRGVTPAVLSQRLKILERQGIVRRRLYSHRPPRAEYALTPKGIDLRPVVRALAVWGARHLRAGIHLVHDSCGHPIEMGYYCPDCGERIASEHVHRVEKKTTGVRARSV